MKYSFFISFLLLFFFLAAPAFPVNDPFVEYLAGVEMLKTAKDMPDAEKAAYYKKLCGITGYNSSMAINKLKTYSDKPEKWASIYSAMIAVIDSVDTNSAEIINK